LSFLIFIREYKEFLKFFQGMDSSGNFFANAVRACITVTITAANMWVHVPVRACKCGVAGGTEAAPIKETIGPWCIAPRTVQGWIHIMKHKEVFTSSTFAGFDRTDAVFTFRTGAVLAVGITAALWIRERQGTTLK